MFVNHTHVKMGVNVREGVIRFFFDFLFIHRTDYLSQNTL